MRNHDARADEGMARAVGATRPGLATPCDAAALPVQLPSTGGALARGSIAIEAPFVSPRLVDREEVATLRAEDGVR